MTAPGAATDSTSIAADSTAVDTLATTPAGPVANDDLADERVPALPDTLGATWELGISTDLSNEQFYEDRYESTFVARTSLTLVTEPETRAAVVGAARLEGTRAARAESWRVRNEASLGDRVQRDALDLQWRRAWGPEWTLAVSPTAEFRHDRTFGRDLEENRISGSARLRRAFLASGLTGESRVTGEWLRTSGSGSVYVPDRNVGGAGLALERADLLHEDWRVGGSLLLRTYPDSVDRDHTELGWEARWRHTFDGGHSVELEGDGIFRRTRRQVPTSRDNFRQDRLSLGVDLAPLERWGGRAWIEGEALGYEVQDSTVFFDTRTVRARLRGRWHPTPTWRIEIGPRGELSDSPLEPSEAYGELAAELEIEALASRSWWSATPVVGWREYDEDQPGSGFATASLHSSYAFFELGLFADQPLRYGTRVRLFGTGRWERHTDASQDARSLYFSLDVRRLF